LPFGKSYSSFINAFRYTGNNIGLSPVRQ